MQEGRPAEARRGHEKPAGLSYESTTESNLQFRRHIVGIVLGGGPGGHVFVCGAAWIAFWKGRGTELVDLRGMYEFGNGLGGMAHV